MEKKMTVTNIAQAQRGSVQFMELDKDKKPVKDSAIVVIQFADPKQAATFEHGKDYTVSFKPTK